MITGTMIAGILGVSKWETPLDIWLKAKGLIEPEMTEAMAKGIYFEPYIRADYEEMRGVTVQTGVKLVHANGLYGGHPDGITDSSIVEFKTTSGVKELPVEWNCQVQWYMYLSERPVAEVYVVELFEMPFEKLRGITEGLGLEYVVRDRHLFRVKRDDEWLAVALPRIEKFAKLLEMDEVPEGFEVPPDILYRVSYADEVEADDGVLQLVSELKEMKQRIKELEREVEVRSKEIKEYMKEKERLVRDGQVLVTWKTATRTDFDSKRFEMEYPELYKQYRKEKTYRVFMVK